MASTRLTFSAAKYYSYLMDSVLRKRIGMVIWYGLLAGFVGGLAVFFLMFPIGLVLHAMGVKVLLYISSGGILSLRYTLVTLQGVIAVIGIGYFAWKEFYKKN